MTTQVIVGALALLILIVYVRRMIQTRSVTQYSPAEVEGLMQKRSSLLLLDVRTAAERQHGSIKGSVHIPLQKLQERLDDLAKNKNKEIVCYCQSGNRSLTAALLLRRNGFKAANMRGGMAEWNFVHR